MPTHRFSRYFPLIFLTLDLLSLNLAVFMADWLKFETFILNDPEYLSLRLTLNLVWLLTFFSAGLQISEREKGLLEQLNKVLTALVVSLSILFALWFITKPLYLSRQHLFYTYALFSVMVMGWRVLAYYGIGYYRARGYNLRNVVVVGRSEVSERIVDYFRMHPRFGYRFLGYFDDRNSGPEVLGKVGDLEAYALQEKVDMIYAYLPKIKGRQAKEVIDFAENNLIKVKIISQFSQLGLKNLSIRNYGSIPVVDLSAIPLDNKFNQIIKRAFDIIFSGVVILTVLSWLIPLIGLLIKLESPGPVFFRQYRNGRSNDKFLIFKFRTMVVHNDQQVKQATKHDNRITRLGAILRKTSIDELPQFLNVFLGDMSVVGPRPHAVKHNEEFSKQIDRFIQRHAVKPGITGLAQAKGFRGETTTFNEISGRVRLDRFYVKNWSLLLDFKIIVLTILSIVNGSEKAY